MNYFNSLSTSWARTCQLLTNLSQVCCSWRDRVRSWCFNALHSEFIQNEAETCSLMHKWSHLVISDEPIRHSDGFRKPEPMADTTFWYFLRTVICGIKMYCMLHNKKGYNNKVVIIYLYKGDVPNLYVFLLLWFLLKLVQILGNSFAKFTVLGGKKSQFQYLIWWSLADWVVHLYL